MSYNKGPVITREVMEDIITNVEYHLFKHTTTMACAIVLGNGFVVVGQSASVPTTQFDPALGMKYSREDAERKLADYLALLVYEGVSTPFSKLQCIIDANLQALKENLNG